MAYTQILYHIVLRTKHSEPSIAQENVSSLYKYIWGIKNKKGQLYRINGIEDHIYNFGRPSSECSFSRFRKRCQSRYFALAETIS
jgi:REP element-mobilizing transposase RayT